MIRPSRRHPSMHSIAACVVRELSAENRSTASNSGKKNNGTGERRMMLPFPAALGSVEPA